MNDFVALLIAVAAFLASMIVARLASLLLPVGGLEDGAPSLAPLAGFVLSLAVGVLAYRRMVRSADA